MLNRTLSAKKTTKTVIYTSIAALLATSMPVHASKQWEEFSNPLTTRSGHTHDRKGGHWKTVKETVRTVVCAPVEEVVHEVIETVNAPREEVESDQSSRALILTGKDRREPTGFTLRLPLNIASIPFKLFFKNVVGQGEEVTRGRNMDRQVEIKREHSPRRPSQGVVAKFNPHQDENDNRSFAARHRGTLKMIGYVMYAIVFIGLLYTMFNSLFGGSEDNSGSSLMLHPHHPTEPTHHGSMTYFPELPIREIIDNTPIISSARDLMVHPDHPITAEMQQEQFIRSRANLYSATLPGHDIIERVTTGALNFFGELFFAERR